MNQRKVAILREMKALKREYNRLSNTRHKHSRRGINIKENYNRYRCRGAYVDAFNLNLKNIDELIEFYKTKALYDINHYQIANSREAVIRIANDAARSISKDVMEIVKIRDIEDENAYADFAGLANIYLTTLSGSLDDVVIDRIEGVLEDKLDLHLRLEDDYIDGRV